MKKLVSLILVASLCMMSLVGCGTSEGDAEKIDSQVASEHNEQDIKYTDAAVLQNAFKSVELTTENWQEYLELKEERIEYFDAFGESLGTYVISNYVGLKDPSVSKLSEDTVIRFTFTVNYNRIGKYQDDEEIANEENDEWKKEVDISYFYYNSDHTGDKLYDIERKDTGMYDGRETDLYETWTIAGLEVSKIKGSVQLFVSSEDAFNWNEPDLRYGLDEPYIAVKGDGKDYFFVKNGSYGSGIMGESINLCAVAGTNVAHSPLDWDLSIIE